MMRYATVCSGIEACTAAWHPLGWQPVFFSEIEPFPSAVLAHHYPSVPNLGDMTKYKEWPDYELDLICGGTPCQSFSVAGLRKGLDDPRGNLMLTFGAIVGRYRPEWLVWENVPGVLSSNGGRDFGTFLGMLGKLGYGFAYRILDAQYFGVAQRRRRVFVVGCLGNWRRAAAVLFERHSLSGHPAPRRKTGQGFAATTAPSLTASGRGVERTGESRGQDRVIATLDRQSSGEYGTAPVVSTVSARDYKGVSDIVTHALRGEGFDASEDGTGRGTPLVPVAFSLMPMNSGKDFKARETDVAQPVMAAGQSLGNQGGDVVLTGQQVAGAICKDSFSGGAGGRTEGAAAGHFVSVAFAIQGAATRENPASGPDGVGVRADNTAYTLEARAEVQAVAFAQNQRDEVRTMDVAGALASEPGMKQQTFVAFHPTQDPISSTDGSIHTMGTGSKGGCATMAVALLGREGGATAELSEIPSALRASGGGGDKAHVLNAMQVRRLTPRECERLQGFPDDYTLIQVRKKPAADGPRYKALGNSMAVPVMRWIGERINLCFKLNLE